MTAQEKQRLIKASDDVFYLIMQMFTYYAWFRHISPRLIESPPREKEMIYFRLVENGVVESQLMFYRRLNEFFYPRPKKEKFPNDLRAYKFGFEELGPFLHDDDMEQLHKRAAHPTFTEADQGKVSYEIYPTSWLGLRHGLHFVVFLQKTLFADLPDKVKGADIFIRAFQDLWHAWSSEIPEDERRILTL